MSIDPIELWPSSSIRIVESGDAGGFYCEHAFYVASQARAVGGRVFDGAGDDLVGFLHVPKDEASNHAEVVVDQAARHRDTIAVVVAALQVMVDRVQPMLDNHQPVQVLLTGYGEWGTVKNNPTGDLVSHAENVAAIRDAITGPVSICPLRLAVDDTAIDGGPASIQAAMKRVRPDVVLSMGVHNGAGYLAEMNATDRCLVERDGGFRRDPEQPARTRLPPNRSLARALQQSQRALT